eukprot:GFUD01137431.1.p1 GENE.GFUD01137431.1~~GFUD01137431.1.p1  ORF type:complete len:124 (+),score=9.42 GFUD01137431.1:375-746(+)
MYKSKFASANKYHQDPIGQRHNHHDPRNYRNGPRNYRNPDPRYYSHGHENPWNEKNNDHRMHDDTKINDKERDLLRWGFLQLIIAIIFVQCLTLQLSLGNSQYSPNCHCDKCLEVRNEQAKHL